MATRKKAIKKAAARKQVAGLVKHPERAVAQTSPAAAGIGTVAAGSAIEDADASLIAALHEAIAGDGGERLRRAAELLLTRAAEGEHWALKELADRLDGRPRRTHPLTAGGR